MALVKIGDFYPDYRDHYSDIDDIRIMMFMQKTMKKLGRSLTF
jgi:hypothetical protein